MEASIERYLKSTGFERFSPKAVLFDMDGVLYDSMPNHAIAWQQSMASFGIRMTEMDAYATEGARGIDTIQRMVKKQTGKDITLDEAQVMYDEKSRLFHLMPTAPVMPGILELMAKIDASGLTIGVVTGSGQRPLIQRLMSDFSDYLSEEHIVTAYDVTHGKPNPEPYLIGMEKCGRLTPSETFVVENAPLGVQAGHAAKAFTIGVNTGILPAGTLTANGADVEYQKMIDLAEAWPLVTI